MLGGIWVPLGAHQLLILLPEVAEQPRAAQPVAGGHGVVGELGDRKGRGPRWGDLPQLYSPHHSTTTISEMEPALGLSGDGIPQPGTPSPSTSSGR